MSVYIGDGKKVSVRVITETAPMINEGTAIPRGERVEKIYFNTGLSQDETNEILSQLTYVQTDFFDAPINVLYALIDEELNGHVIVAIEAQLGYKTGYYINYFNSPFNENVSYGTPILFSPRTDLDETIINNGWYYNLYGDNYNWGYINSISINLLGFPLGYPLTDFNGLPVGAENDKIKNVLSITPFYSSSDGDCSDEYIIEVNELPYENINEKAVYLYDSNYYKYEKQLVNVVVWGYEVNESNFGVPCVFHYTKTKPIENIYVSTLSTAHIYYIEDENNLFVYAEVPETGENLWVPAASMIGGDLSSFSGVVGDVSEATDGLYAIVNDGWSEYVRASAGWFIGTNGSYTVAGDVIVDVPNEALNGKWKFNASVVEDFIAEQGEDYDGNLTVDPLYFTSVMDGAKIRFRGLRIGYDTMGDPRLEYWYRDDIGETRACGHNGWQYESMQTVDFGVEPQIVSAEVKRFMETHAVHIEEGSYDDGVEAGKKTEYDAFWDVYQQNGSSNYSTFSGVFSGVRFNAGNFFPKYDIKPVGSSAYLFYAWEKARHPEVLDLKQRLQDCGVVLDTSGATDITYMFGYCSALCNIPTIDCTGLTTASAHVFANMWNTNTMIEKLIVNDTVTYSNWFVNTTGLVEIRFEGVIGHDIAFPNASALSTESVQSIIDHLKDLTGATAQTLTLHADVGAKLTDTQKSTITAKNWQLVY